jgi:aryl-alcohol dehydrogenase-like predicted oxidoreductase
MTSDQVALAWILAEHSYCEHLVHPVIYHDLLMVFIIPIPGSRSIAHVEENVSSAEFSFASDDEKAIRQLSDVQERHPAEFVYRGYYRVG